MHFCYHYALSIMVSLHMVQLMAMYLLYKVNILCEHSPGALFIRDL